MEVSPQSRTCKNCSACINTNSYVYLFKSNEVCHPCYQRLDRQAHDLCSVSICESAYAGIFVRLLAFLIDSIPLGIVIWVNSKIYLFNLKRWGNQTSTFFGEIGENLYIGHGVILIFFFWLYFAYLVGSKYQATPGQQLLGLVVTDREGERVTGMRASGRFLGMLVTFSTYGIGFFTILFTRRNQSLHDLISGCLVLRKEPKQDSAFGGQTQVSDSTPLPLVSPHQVIGSISAKEDKTVTVPVAYCPQCHKRFKIKPAWDGKKTRCPRCAIHFDVKLIWKKLKTARKRASSPDRICCVYCDHHFESLEKPILIDNEPVCHQCKEGVESGDTILSERDPLKRKLRRMSAIAPYVRQCQGSVKRGVAEILFGLFGILLGASSVSENPYNIFLILLGCFMVVTGILFLITPRFCVSCADGVSFLCIGIWNLYVTVQNMPTGDSYSLFWGLLGLQQTVWGLRITSRYDALQVSIPLVKRFPLIEEEVKQALTGMFGYNEPLLEDMIAFHVGNRIWKGRLSSEYAVFVSGNRVFFLARDEVKLHASNADIPNSNKKVKIQVHLGDDKMEAQMTSSDVKQLTIWLESE